MIFTLEHSKLTEGVFGCVDENSIERDNTIGRIESYKVEPDLTVTDSRPVDLFDQAFAKASLDARQEKQPLFEVTSYDPSLATPSDGKTYTLIFIYRSIFDNYCMIHKKVSIEEISDFKIRRNEYNTMFYCESSFLIEEKLFLIGALKDMRTIFLLGFLFDYEKI